MPEVTAEHYPPGTPCWIDLMAPDQQAALDFYRDLFGWQGEVGPPEFGGYAMCTLNGKPVAGIMKAQPMNEGDPVPPTVWTSYLASADADATQAAITAAGGTVMFPAMDVGTVGRMLVAADPTGAVFGVWQPVDFYGAQVVNEAGALCWNELHTEDLPAARAFYRQALGIESELMEGMTDYFAAKVSGRPVGGLTTLGGQAPPGTPPHWLVYFAVDDTDSTVDALVKRGGNVLVPPFDMVAGRMAVVADPQGAVFAVIKPVPM
ncbi:glyoxalase [Kitasatospora sp. MMS16-BH015]|uniref:VOC family protein n=1 Tax=Kitasatospora sp. MMS16-BH015 TaxID=2018025 RepID=UPI000CA28B75|nr:VOC family protein [Kitasatospora sp. MMS16-BH015]AUG78980.1 glyoxalase [Kitasatospora sp. MMS16-BH015]